MAEIEGSRCALIKKLHIKSDMATASTESPSLWTTHFEEIGRFLKELECSMHFAIVDILSMP